MCKGSRHGDNVPLVKDEGRIYGDDSRLLVFAMFLRYFLLAILAFKVGEHYVQRLVSETDLGGGRSKRLERPKLIAVFDLEIRLSARWRALPRRHRSVSHYAERRHDSDPDNCRPSRLVS
jgi:hypothetical protein